MKRPAFQFYPADWRRDAALQSCSVAARGLWIELMCVMHDCDPYGVLAVNGRPMSSAQLARLVGEQEKAVVRMLAELEDAGVCSRDEEGRLFSRRMVKDERVREARAAGGQAGAEHGYKGGEHGKKGGRPRKSEVGMVVGEITPLKTPLEFIEEPPPSSSSSSSVKEEAKASLSASAQPPDVDEPDDGVPPCPFDSLIDSYEAALPVLPTVRRSLFAKGANGKSMRARWRWVMTAKHERGERKGERLATTADEGKAWFARYFAYVADSDFLSGRNGKFQSCDLGWLVTAANFEKVLSGKYHHEQREVAHA